MPTFASIHSSAKNSVSSIKKIRNQPVLLANFCILVLNSGEVLPGISLVSKDTSGKEARNRAKATLRSLQSLQAKDAGKGRKPKLSKQVGIGIGFIRANEKKRLTFFLIKDQNANNDMLQRTIRKLASQYGDLGFLKTAVVSIDETRESLIGGVKDSFSGLDDAQVLAALEEAGMADETERADYLAIIRADIESPRQLDTVNEGVDAELEKLSEELDRQHDLIEAYQTALPGRKAAIIADLLKLSDTGEDLPISGGVSPYIQILVAHIQAAFELPAVPHADMFAELEGLAF